MGTPVVAVRSGTVLDADEDSLNGKYIRLDIGDGYTVVYAHLDEILAAAGRRVEQGQIVAFSGNTGRSSGPHLHYSVYKDGILCDPLEFASVTE